MVYEVEQKFPVADLDVLQSRLVELGARLHAVVDQRDCYFAHPARDFHQTDEALRIRQVGAANLIAYKGPRIDAETKTRREIELPLGDGPAVAERFVELIGALGFTSAGDVHKIRQPLTIAWQGWDITGALDRVTGLGSFAELELCVAPARVDAARQAIMALAGKLGLGATERRSYLELLAAARS